MSSGPAKRQSWKQARQVTAKQGPNKPARWLLTFLSMGLIAAFVFVAWILFWHRTMPTQIVAMQSGQSRAGVPSLPHSTGDLQPLSKISWPYYRFDDQSAWLQSNQSFTGLSSYGSAEFGVLIVYVSAHGVTNITSDGSVNVLCRDYDLAAPQKAAFEIAAWLEELKNCNARTKLLIFDSGTIVSDPRLGMLVNDFPRRVAELVQQWDDSDLWVILSHATLQTPFIAGANEKSLFGTALVEGLLGKADAEEHGGNKDNDVTLEELYRYVVARCSKISAGLQRPLLLRAGTPAAELFEIPDLPLLAISATEKAQEEAASDESVEANQESTSAEASQQAGDSPAPSNANGGAGQEQGTQLATVAGDANSKRPTADTNQDLLIEAWRLRDQIESTSVSEGWLPQEYAPHLWRQLLDFLVEFDLRRSSAGDPLESNLAEHVQGLQDLQTCLLNPSHPISNERGRLVVDDLLRASRSFLTSPAKRKFETDSQKLREVASAVRTARRISFLVPYFVRWHANAGLVGVVDDTVAARIAFLLPTLNDFQVEYDRIRGKQLTPSAEIEIARLLRDVTQGYADLNRDLRRHIANVCKPQQSQQLKARTLLQARALLAGPLPTAEEREMLMNVVSVFEMSEEPSSEQVRRVALPQLDNIDRWKDLQQQLRLEQQLVQLQKTQWQPPTLSQDLSNLDVIGAKLRDVYQESVNELANAAEPSSSRLLFLDGRDAKRIGWRDELALKLDIAPPYIKPSLSIDGAPRVLELSDGKSQIVKIRVSSKEQSPNRGTIRCNFDPRIDVRPSSTSFRLDRPSELSFQVLAKPGYGERRQKIEPIVFTASLTGFVDGKQKIETWLAGPNRIELVVTQENAMPKKPGAGGFLLRAFPNRSTPFRFAAGNPSNTDKTVVASLYQVPLTISKYIAPGRLFNRQGHLLTKVEAATLDGGQPRRGLKLIAASKPITLAPGSEPEALDFSPQPPPPPSDAEKQVETPPPSVTAKAESKLDVSQGILCEIREQGPGGEAWLSWIELDTVPPRDYVKTVVSYDLTNLSVKCSLKPNWVVPGLAEKPIPIQWDLSQVSDNVRAAMGNVVIKTDSIKNPADPAELIQATIDSIEDEVLRVHLHVDHYPRALTFDVKLDEVVSKPDADSRRDLNDIRLISVGMTGHPKSYVTSPAFLPEKPDEKNPVSVLQYRNGRREIAAFPAAKLGSQLKLRFQVDAPVIAFGGDSSDQLTLRIDTPGFDPISLFGDREVKFEVEAVGSDGLLSIRSTITDYDQGIDLPDSEGSYELVAELTALHDDYDAIRLTFDDTPPRLITFQVPPKISLNSQLPLALIADDESGLESVEYAIVDEPSAVPQKMIPLPFPLAQSVLLQANGLVAGQRYYLKLRLVDRAGNELITDGRRGAPRPLEFSVFKPAPAVGPPGGVRPGTIRGKVALGAYGPPRIKVELTGGKRFPPFETKTGGAFEFKNVPAGDYVLKASGNPLNRGTHEGEFPISIKKQEDFAQPVVIDLEPEKKE